MRLSVIIPAYKEQYLQKTIDSLLEGSEGELEIIAVLDGYWPSPPLREDSRVHLLHFGKSRGMRAAINAGVELSKGKYIMKTDAHCMFAKGWDTALLKDIQDDWLVIPRRFKLDPVKWEVMPGRGTDYDKILIIPGYNKFHGQDWISRTKERANIMIDETMSFQGSCWLMRRKLWRKIIKNLDEKGYGKFVQEPVEIGMKVWQSGGKIMVNKNTWYAHKHRMFNRTHNVPREEADAGYAYALKLWMGEYLKLKERFGV